MIALTQVAPHVALQRLQIGNERFAAGCPTHPRQDELQRVALLNGQHPFAAILGCSDSRVPPEILFDQGIGDLFVVRTAGNILDDVVVGSLEYAVEHLGVSLVVVLGHQECGAVTATAVSPGASGHISSVVQHIQPAVEHARHQAGELIPNAIIENIRLVTAELENSQPLLEPLIRAGKLKIQPAYYSMEEGRVRWL
jgi:carbonic anhydrase